MPSYIQVILPLKLSWIPYYLQSEPTVVGDKVRVVFSGKEYIGVAYSLSESLPPELSGKKILPILGVEKELRPISTSEIALWKEVSEYYMCTIGEVFKCAYPARKLRQEKVEASKKKTAKAGASFGEVSFELSAAQAKAYGEILAAFSLEKPALLRGVTGSGKTEIYSRLALETLKTANVLYLVPEIALSRQLEQRLGKIFGSRLLVFHSKETPARRALVASTMASGRYILLGTRSSVFLPHHDLGLIIVDEEHDGSYKQSEPAPRYNGRDVAAMLARNFEGCKLILGSATPSLESLYNSRAGRYSLVELPIRYHGAQNSEVEIIDTIAERKKGGMMGSLSYKLIAHISQTLSRGGQVMLLRDRRSYSPALQCSSCGSIPKCPNCNIALSLHKDGRERLLCHHCGYSLPYDDLCPCCGGTYRPIGAGSQKIEEEAAALWPSVRVSRLDSDIAQKAATEVIRDFAAGEIGILVGTRLVGKGFDFKGVELVAVIDADYLLSLDDFRADEKAAQLLEQFRGRCGRRESRGLFVVQTACPDHLIYKRYALGEEGETALSLLRERYDFRYPPYTRLIEVSIDDKNLERARAMRLCLENRLKSDLPEGSFTLVGSYQFRLTLSLAKDRHLSSTKQALRKTISQLEADYHYEGHIILDVDPY